jgi:hypothetical protein
MRNARGRMAAGNWSVVNRTLLYKPCPENFPFDKQAIDKRFGRAGKSLISLEVLRAVQHALR